MLCRAGGCGRPATATQGVPLCAVCRRNPRWRLLSERQALSAGYPLATLREVGAVHTHTTCHHVARQIFLERHLLLTAQREPAAFNPLAARRDLAQLKRDRREALPELDSARKALMRDPALAPWCDGMHVVAVAHGLATRKHALAFARAARDAWVLLRRLNVGVCTRLTIARALDGCAASWVGVRLLYTASDLRAMRNMPRPFTERRVCVAIIDRTLRSVHDLPMAIYHRARAVAWTPELHVFLCGRDTRRGVRELLLHFCRQLGVGGGSAFVRGICAALFAESPPQDQAAPETELRTEPADIDIFDELVSPASRAAR